MVWLLNRYHCKLWKWRQQFPPNHLNMDLSFVQLTLSPKRSYVPAHRVTSQQVWVFISVIFSTLHYCLVEKDAVYFVGRRLIAEDGGFDIRNRKNHKPSTFNTGQWRISYCPTQHNPTALQWRISYCPTQHNTTQHNCITMKDQLPSNTTQHNTTQLHYNEGSVTVQHNTTQLHYN